MERCRTARCLLRPLCGLRETQSGFNCMVPAKNLPEYLPPGSDRLHFHCTGTNTAQTGEPTSTFCPVGVSFPVFESMRKTTMLPLS